MIENDDNLHYFCNDKDQWEIRENNSGELLASFECDDDSIEWVQDSIAELKKERDEALAKIKELELALDFIHDMAYEDLRTAQNTTSTWSIEAVAAKALGLSDEQRDLGVTADDKLAELIAYVAQKCDDEVAKMWKTWTVTVSPETKERLIDEHGLDESHFVQANDMDYKKCPRCETYSLYVEYETSDELHWELSDCHNCDYHHYGQDTRELDDIELPPLFKDSEDE